MIYRRFIVMSLVALLSVNVYAEGEAGAESTYDAEEEHALDPQYMFTEGEDTEGEANEKKQIVSMTASGEQQTTIIDENGSLRIIDKSQPQTPAAEPRSLQSMPATGAPNMPPSANQPPPGNNSAQPSPMPNQGQMPAPRGQYPQGQMPAPGGQYPQGQMPAPGGQYPQGQMPAPRGQYPQGQMPAPGGQYPQGQMPAPGGQYPQGQMPAPGGQYPQGQMPVPGGQYPQGQMPAPGGQYPQGQMSPTSQYSSEPSMMPSNQYPSSPTQNAPIPMGAPTQAPSSEQNAGMLPPPITSQPVSGMQNPDQGSVQNPNAYQNDNAYPNQPQPMPPPNPNGGQGMPNNPMPNQIDNMPYPQ